MTTLLVEHEFLETSEHERNALRLMSSAAGHAAWRWRVLRRPKPTTIYDWASPGGGRVGQAWLDASGEWGQAPLGDLPVLLELVERGLWPDRRKNACTVCKVAGAPYAANGVRLCPECTPERLKVRLETPPREASP